MSDPELSVVLAADGPPAALEAAVHELGRACAGLAAELIVVAEGAGPARTPPGGGFVASRVERCPAGTLTPVLWGAGLRVARGRTIAFTTDQLRVGPGWARALIGAVDAGAVGAGGPIALAQDADAATCAAWLIRFSAFLPSAWPAGGAARDVAGDNAAYRGDALRRHDDLVREGFWEVEFHRRFERDGGVLRIEPDATATLAGPVPFGSLLRRRFRHAREFGATRVGRHGESRLRILGAAPAVPLILLARIRRRARAEPGGARAFRRALPRLVLLTAAWAAGEAAGALLGPRRAG